MAMYALDHLGATEQQISDFVTYYLEATDLKEMKSPEPINDLLTHLGEREYYESYVDYFLSEINKKSISRVVSETLNTLILGLSSSLFHGLIRINYAMTKQEDNEVARALASLACAYQAVEFTGEIIVPDQLYPEINRYISEREGLFYMEGNINVKIEAILRGLLELYIKTGSFIVLHTITGFEALLSLRVYYDDFTHVVDVFMVSALRCLLRITAEDYKEIELHELMSWEEMLELVKHVKNAHTIKFIYSLRKLRRLYDLKELRLAAAIKFALDHDL
jgi:hypothetical protein